MCTCILLYLVFTTKFRNAEAGYHRLTQRQIAKKAMELNFWILFSNSRTLSITLPKLQRKKKKKAPIREKLYERCIQILVQLLKGWIKYSSFLRKKN